MVTLVDSGAPARELVRNLRSPCTAENYMPESVAWQTWVVLRERGEPTADKLFLGAVRRLHTRRCVAGSTLSAQDGTPDEHRLTGDAYLADLWKAYKKCIQNNRPGPASALLRDIEERLEDK